MGSLTLLATIFSESPPQLVLFSEKCLRSRLNTNQCQRCLESCSCEALSVNNRKIALDIDQCTGCMSCVAACPQDALVSDYDLGELLSSFQSEADVVVSCIHQVQNHADEIRIPCVGILSKQVLVAMFLSGCRSVSFTMVGCAACRNRDVSGTFLVNCRQVVEELSDINVTKVVLVEKREQLTNPRTGRRTYLTKLFDIAGDVSRNTFLSKQVTPLAKPRKSRNIPLKTQLVKKVLTNVHGDAQEKILGLFGHNVSISEACNCCPLCKGICPTGAIKLHRTDQGKRLKFETLDCSGCGLCVEFCKKNALSLEPFSPRLS